MEKRTEAVRQFENFGQERLSNHLAELNTRYENEKPDKDVLQQAYREHREIFNKELEEKIQSLLSSESNSQLKGELINIKDTYFSKLHLKHK